MTDSNVPLFDAKLLTLFRSVQPIHVGKISQKDGLPNHGVLLFMNKRDFEEEDWNPDQFIAEFHIELDDKSGIASGGILDVEAKRKLLQSKKENLTQIRIYNAVVCCFEKIFLMDQFLRITIGNMGLIIPKS